MDLDELMACFGTMLQLCRAKTWRPTGRGLETHIFINFWRSNLSVNFDPTHVTGSAKPITCCEI